MYWQWCTSLLLYIVRRSPRLMRFRVLIAGIILAAGQLAESYNQHHGRGGREQEQDHYKVLGLNRGASENDIKRAYHKLAQKWSARSRVIAA